MSHKVQCAACGDRIKGKIILLGSADFLVEAGICEPGPHCEGCHQTGVEEFKDTKGAIEAAMKGSVQ